MKKTIIVLTILFYSASSAFAQCKISQDKFPDGTMYQQTEPSLMYQTSKKKIVERLSTDEENYFISISPSPFLPKPAGEKQKKDLIAVLSNGKTYKLSHFDSRYIDKDSSFQMLFLFDKKDIADFRKYDIQKVVLNDGTAVDATYTLVLHPDAVKKQFACFMKKAEN
jgi:hypothetical protein